MPASSSRFRSLATLLANPSDRLVAVRTVGWLSVLPILKRTLPLPVLVRLMWKDPVPRPRNRTREEHVAALVRRIGRTSGGNCLERSLILYRLLSRANAEPRLVVGIGKPDNFLGHVWVTVDGRPLLESDEALRAYTKFISFGAGGRREA